MTIDCTTGRQASRLLEICLWVALAWVLLFCVYSIFHLNDHGYLPAPFFFNIQDTWMDFYNVNWWAVNGEFYTKYKSIYSPINIIFGKTATIDPELPTASAGLRQMETHSVIAFEIIIVAISMILMTQLMAGFKHRMLWLLLLTFSFPFLYATERGNYILITYILLLWHIKIRSGPINHTLHKASEVLLISSKIHLAIIWIGAIIRRDWRAVSFNILTLGVFLVFLGYLAGDTRWYLIPENIINFLNHNSGKSPTELLSPQTSLAGMWKQIDSVYHLDWYTRAFLKAIVYTLSIAITVTYTKVLLNFKNGMVNDMLLTTMTILFLLLQTSALGFYSIILLYPLFIYFISTDRFGLTLKLQFIFLIVPYPLFISKPVILDMQTAFSWAGVQPVSVGLTLQDVMTPIILILLFYSVNKSCIVNNTPQN